ncbi:uncharacterized protein LOC124977309 [Sciurus carolinensis]|uniref:uncharacterized protein LOC124977309 n=1 Tax=Sciurus carolinensis TaxID=30640 RepID=UPI001FB50924|nr:uncharacterized protein LOC124977309 [Sciurus carolinensis]
MRLCARPRACRGGPCTLRIRGEAGALRPGEQGSLPEAWTLSRAPVTAATTGPPGWDGRAPEGDLASLGLGASPQGVDCRCQWPGGQRTEIAVEPTRSQMPCQTPGVGTPCLFCLCWEVTPRWLQGPPAADGLRGNDSSLLWIICSQRVCLDGPEEDGLASPDLDCPQMDSRRLLTLYAAICQVARRPPSSAGKKPPWTCPREGCCPGSSSSFHHVSFDFSLISF